MSTGIAFLRQDGIVIGTDTQYTSAWKLGGQKLFEITGKNFNLCIAGAGNVSHIRKAVELMGKEVAKAGDLGGHLKTGH